MPQQPLEYRSPSPKVKRSVGSFILFTAGLGATGWGIVGAMFVEGAVEAGNPNVSRAGVVFLLLLACAGIAAIVFAAFGFPRQKAGT